MVFDRGQDSEERLLMIFFFIAGTSTEFGYPLIMTAAGDVLSGLVIPTSVVLISTGFPGLLITLASPFFFDRIGIPVKICAAASCMFAGLLVVALVQGESKLAGVVLISLSTSISEMTFLAMTGFYEDSARTVGSYCAGNGLAVVLGNAYYLVLTVLLHVPPKAAVLIVSWVPSLLMIGSYLMLQKRDNNDFRDPETSYNGYKLMPLTDEEDKPVTKTRLNTKGKILAIWETLHHFIAFLIGQFCIYITLQGITSTLVYEHTGLTPREVFVVYNSVNVFASSIGRSYSFIISLVNPSVQTYTKHTWALATAAVILMLFLLIESWYRFLNSIVLVNLLLTFIGLIFGVLYVNVFTNVGGSKDSRRNVVTRAFTLAAWDGGMLLAGLTALYVEPIIQQHCLYLTKGKAELCLARSNTSVL